MIKIELYKENYLVISKFSYFLNLLNHFTKIKNRIRKRGSFQMKCSVIIKKFIDVKKTDLEWTQVTYIWNKFSQFSNQITKFLKFKRHLLHNCISQQFLMVDLLASRQI